jgi:hypothetical protein
VSSNNIVYHISYTLKPSSKPKTLVKVVTDKSIPFGPDPVLSSPVIVNTDPDAVPEPEKTLLQKYWHFALPLGVLLLVATGAGPQEPAQAAN